jgi:magnesium transporter
MVAYYQDIYDHVLRATEWTESLRDLVTTILETRLTIQGNRMNGIMRSVTSWAAIIAVPTAITGFYGQNVPYPGYANDAGFCTSTAVTVVLSVALYVLFRRHDRTRRPRFTRRSCIYTSYRRNCQGHDHVDADGR